jgi:hypothetical protein
MIIKNQAICCSCGDRVISQSDHDYQSCSCGSIAVDGGSKYTRRVIKANCHYIEASVYTIDKFDKTDISGNYMVYSPDGVNLPSVCFSYRKDAEEVSLRMQSEYGGRFYICKIEKP